MSIQATGVSPPLHSHSTIHFKLEGENGFALILEKGQCVATYPIKQSIFTHLPKSDLPRSLEETIRELLRRNFIPAIEERSLVWISPLQRMTCLLCAKEKARISDCVKATESILEAYRMVDQMEDPFGKANFLEKLDRRWLQTLFDETKNPDLELLILKKEAIRFPFETALKELSELPSNLKKPSCFICFSIGDEEVEKWLENTFVADMRRVEIEAILCYRNAPISMNIKDFQRRILSADQVIIICTSDLKQKCEERSEDPYGVAEEVRLANERSSNPERRGTVFPVYLKGDHTTACPKEFVDILGTTFTIFDRSTSAQFFTYYTKAFELFACMRGIKRSIARQQMTKEFFLTVETVTRMTSTTKVREWLKKKKMQQNDPQTWHVKEVIRLMTVGNHLTAQIKQKISELAFNQNRDPDSTTIYAMGILSICSHQTSGLDENHPIKIQLHRGNASCLRNLESYDAALAECEKAQNVARTLHGPKSQEMLEIIKDKKRIYEDKGDQGKAGYCMVEILRILKYRTAEATNDAKRAAAARTSNPAAINTQNHPSN